MKMLRKLRSLFRKEKLDRDMAEEMRLHVDLQTERNVGAGMPADEARYAALRQFGNVASLQERAREQRGWRWLEDGLRDVRFAFRSLRKTPGFTGVAVLTLALGIGCCTVMFSVVNSVLLRPLGFEEPNRVVQLWEDWSGTRGERNTVSGGIFADWRDQATMLEHISVMLDSRQNLGDIAESVRLEGRLVSASFLEVLRLRPILGRGFLLDEDQPGRSAVMLISHAVWQRSFGADPGVIGRTVRLGAEARTIIGVLPPNFLFSDRLDFIVPFVWGSEAWHRERGDHRLMVIARLKENATLEEAGAELQSIAQRMSPMNPPWKRDWGATVVPLQEEMTGRIRPALVLLFGAVMLVLLIACANLANLLLAKAAARRREIAVRLAIGGSRARIVRLLLTESVVLALLGGAAGLLVAWGSVGALARLGEEFLPRAQEIAIDGRVLGFTLAVATLTGLIFGAAPAWKLSRGKESTVLNAHNRSFSPARDRLRSTLIVGQVALALMLTAGAGLMLKSLAQLLAVSPGFTPSQVLASSLSPDAANFPDRQSRVALFRNARESLLALPAVEAVGFTQNLPMWQRSDTLLHVENRVDQPEHGYSAEFAMIAGDYFSALGITRLQGRDFTERDQQPDSPGTIIVNQAFADSVFPGEDPVGRHLVVWNDRREIIGVVNNVRHLGLDRDSPAQIYMPVAYDARDVHLLMRTKNTPETSIPAVRAAMAEVDPRLPLGEIRTLEFLLVESTANRRLIVALLGAFACTALLLAALGLSGVIAYSVSRRTREFGIRLALGATRAQILRLVLRDGVGLTLLGIALGLGGTLALTRVLRAWLFGTAPTDPVTLASVTLVLLAVGLGSCLVPARRATKVEPVMALRAE